MVRQVTLGLFPSDGPLGNNRLPLRILFPKLDPVPKFHRQKFYGHCNRRSGRLSPFRSAPRLREAPPKIPNLIFLSGDFHVHQSLQGPFLFVFLHLCRRPPLPHSAPGRPSLSLRLSVVVAGLQTGQRDGREPPCHPEGSEGSAFRRCISAKPSCKPCPSPSTSTPATPIPGAKPSASPTNSPPITWSLIP